MSDGKPGPEGDCPVRWGFQGETSKHTSVPVRDVTKGEICMKNRTIHALLGTAFLLCLLPSEVQAHWCHDMWGSAYNLVVRPESDTVTVPSSGSASLTIYVQNNMEYALPNWELSAEASGATITATRQTQKVNGTLLPGEKAKYTLAITKSGGGTFNATDLDFSVSFGNGQSGLYPSSGAKAAMIKKADGSLYPTPPAPSVGTGNDQASNLYYAAAADFGNSSDGLDKLMKLYCAGRGSWSSTSMGILKGFCDDATTVACPTTTPGTGNGSKFDYVRLWAAGELGARRSALGSRAAILRKRLECGINDNNNGFAGFAMFVLGYLGEDAEARTFIEGKIGAGGDLGTIAKAALLLMGNADDMAKYKADVTTGTSSSSIFVKAACAAALGIVAKDDAAVTNTLIPLCKWTEPDTSDNGQAIYSAQILNLVAWDRRGWAPNAGDTGAVSFYGETASGGGGGPGSGGAQGTGGRSGTGGVSGAGGRSGSGGATGSGGSVSGGSSGRGGTSGSAGGPGSGGRTGSGSGGRTGAGGATVASGGAAGSGSAIGAGGATVGPGGAGGSGGRVSTSGAAGSSGVAGSGGEAAGGSGGDPIGGGGGSDGSGGDTGGGTTKGGDGTPGGCSCGLGGRASDPGFLMLSLAGLAFALGRRRRR
jgi:hypothetical protein